MLTVSCAKILGIEELSQRAPDAAQLQPGDAAPQKPADAAPLEPDAAVNSAAAKRVVAVIHRSAGMASEDPRRIDVAVNAVKNCIDLLNIGSEFSLASFADAESGIPPGMDATKDFPAAGLRTIQDAADRTDAQIAADGLLSRTGGLTNIGSALREARRIFSETEEDVTPNSWVFLLAGGLNNRPLPDPQADLDTAVQALSDAGLPVFVTCIGSARDSLQCPNIADGTAGRFVDSLTTAGFHAASVEFVARAERNDLAQTQLDIPIAPGELSTPIPVVVEPGVQQARFVVSWTKPTSDLDLQLFRPDGTQMPVNLRVINPQSEFYRIDMPEDGTWTMLVQGTTVPEPEQFSAHALVDHKQLSFDAGIARSAITWPDGFLISAQASLDAGIKGCDIQARVLKPDGTSEVVELQDEGATSETNNGRYSILYNNFTAGDGIYTFLVRARCEQAMLTPAVPTFERTLRFSGIVIGVP
jgi:hypothetical protein